MTLIALSYMAGILTILNPFVSPLIFIFLLTTQQKNRLAPLILLLGLACTFTFMGFSLTSSLMIWDFELKKLRLISALLLLGGGGILAYPPLFTFLQNHLRPIFAKIHSKIYPRPSNDEVTLEKLNLNFILGIILGIIWLPFIVPLLSFSLSLAYRGDYSGQVYLLMTLYTFGLITPLITTSLLAKTRRKRELIKKGSPCLKWFGYTLITISFLIFAGCDSALETWTISHSPQWILNLTTRY